MCSPQLDADEKSLFLSHCITVLHCAQIDPPPVFVMLPDSYDQLAVRCTPESITIQ